MATSGDGLLEGQQRHVRRLQAGSWGLSSWAAFRGLLAGDLLILCFLRNQAPPASNAVIVNLEILIIDVLARVVAGAFVGVGVVLLASVLRDLHALSMAQTGALRPGRASPGLGWTDARRFWWRFKKALLRGRNRR